VREARELLRVARVIISARPIRLDKSRVKRESDRIAQKMVRDFRKLPEGEGIGRYVANFHTDVVNVAGETVPVVVVVKSASGKMPKPTWISAEECVMGGGAGTVPGKKDRAVLIQINGNYYPRLFDTDVFRRELYKIMLHELTHVADKYRRSEKTRRRVPTLEELDLEKYYNEPAEVRAYMQEIVEEVRGYFPAIYEHRGRRDAMKYSLKLSETWERIEPHLTRRNKNKILSAVWSEIQDLMDVQEKAASSGFAGLSSNGEVMKRETEIAERVAASMTATRFTIPPFLPSSREKGVKNAILILESALSNKHIWNVDYKDVKDTLNRAVDRSRDEMWQRFWRDHGKEETPDVPYYDSPTGLHLIPSFLKKMKRYEGVWKDEIIGWAEAWLPYTQAVKELKPYIEKGRKVDPNKPVKEKYVAPRTSTGGVRLVTEALNKVVASQADELARRIAQSHLDTAQTFLDKREDRQSVYDYFKRDAVRRQIVDRLVEDTSSGPRTFKPESYEMKSDAAAIARKVADAQVKEMVDRYIHKNTNKIGSVVERKGGLEKIKVAYGRLKGWGFEGELICLFADSASFTVRNKAVLHFTHRGTQYMQFPTTFHSVVWPDGKRSAMLSEKQMNEDWAKA